MNYITKANIRSHLTDLIRIIEVEHFDRYDIIRDRIEAELQKL